MRHAYLDCTEFRIRPQWASQGVTYPLKNALCCVKPKWVSQSATRITPLAELIEFNVFFVFFWSQLGSVSGEKKWESTQTTNTNTTRLLIFNVRFSAFPGIRPRKPASIENRGGHCVCVACFGKPSGSIPVLFHH